MVVPVKITLLNHALDSPTLRYANLTLNHHSVFGIVLAMTLLIVLKSKT